MTAEPSRRWRVLIVDDSSFVRRVIRLLLEDDGRFEVVGEAADGEAGLELADALHPDVITLDQNMPRMNGIEMLSRLRNRSDVPVVIVSGLPVAMEDRAQSTNLSRVAIVVKTFSDSSIDLSVFATELIATISAMCMAADQNGHISTTASDAIL